jgi:hypothetical protein
LEFCDTRLDLQAAYRRARTETKLKKTPSAHMGMLDWTKANKEIKSSKKVVMADRVWG